MTRIAEIADYLLSVDFAEIDAAGEAALAREIARRWPDVTAHDLDAGYQIVALEMAAQLADRVADRFDALAIAYSRATSANVLPT